MKFLPLVKIAEFLLIASLVVATAWRSWRGPFLRVAKEFDISYRIPRFALGIWLILAGAFCALFWREREFTQLLALLLELGGVTYLAREVYVAQHLEQYLASIEKVRQFVALESLIDDKEYARAYYKLDHKTQKEAEDDISAAEGTGDASNRSSETKGSSQK